MSEADQAIDHAASLRVRSIRMAERAQEAMAKLTPHQQRIARRLAESLLDK